MSKSSTAALSAVTSSLSGERERKEKKGREGEGGGGTRDNNYVTFYKTTACTLVSELPKNTKILVSPNNASWQEIG